jgi:hypothetical protein
VISRLALAAAIVVAPALAGQPAAAADAAATVNDVDITVDEFDSLVTSLEDAGFAQFAPAPGSRTIDGETGRSLLTLLLTNEARGQFFTSIGEEPVTDADIEAVIEEAGEGSPIQALEGAGRAAIGADQVYVQRLEALEPDVAALQETYEEQPASVGVYCATAVNVTGDAAADTVRGALADGATVAEAAEAADATTSDWQCARLAGVADPQLRADLLDAEPGDALGPVNTADGPVLLVIDEWDVASGKLENYFLRLADEGETSAGTILFEGFLLSSDVTVNPRFGRWDTTTGSIVPLGQ